MKKLLMVVVVVGALGVVFGACKKPAGGDEAAEGGDEEGGDEEGGDEEGGDEEGGDEEGGGDEGGGGGGACADYEACCKAYIEALSGVDGVPEATIDASKQSCESIEQLKGTPGADEGCQQGLDALKQGAEAMKAMPGFEMPDACK